MSRKSTKCSVCGCEYPNYLNCCPVCYPLSAFDAPAHGPQDGCTPHAAGAEMVLGADAPVPLRSKRERQALRIRCENPVKPLVLGILSLVVPGVGIVLGILAIILGAAAVRNFEDGSTDCCLARAGRLLGIVSIAWQALLIAACAASGTTDAAEGILDTYTASCILSPRTLPFS